MLIGEYKHTIDEKNRISMPAKFRKEMGKKIVVTHGLDNCLFLYSLEEWEKISEKLGTLGMGQSNMRGFSRLMFGGAYEIEIDSVGRMLIPESLKDYAGLIDQVVFAGVYNRVEIWNETTWNKYKTKTEKSADLIAEKLGEIGAI